MDREEWDRIVGCDNSLVADLEWGLFQAYRAVESIENERENSGTDFVRDQEVYDHYVQKRDDCRLALAALYTAGRS